jgi:cysteine desulfurase / selenocysteine lyase
LSDARVQATAPTGGGPKLGDRSAFPALSARAYLAHAAVAPLGARVTAELERVQNLAAAQGIGAFGELLAGAARARGHFAALIGACAADVAVQPNTSAAAGAIAAAMPWRAGDRVVLFEGEFPANVLPWLGVARRSGLEVTFVPLAPFERSHAEGLDTLERVLAQRPTRLVAASAVQFQSGLALPLAAIGRLTRAHGARLFVDAIQAVGAGPIDAPASGVDYLAAGGHKWLMGPLGCAYLWVRPEAAEELTPLTPGWTAVEGFDAFLFGGAEELRYDRPLRAGAARFEGGVLPFALLAGAAVAMEDLLALGPAAIAAHIAAWHDRIEARLLGQGFHSRRHPEPAGRSGILSVEAPADLDPQALVQALARRGVVATAPCGLLRLAPHWPNALEETDFVADTIEAAVAELRGARRVE